MHVTFGHGSALLWRWYVEYFRFCGWRHVLYHGANGPESSTTSYIEEVHQVAEPAEHQTTTSFGRVSPNASTIVLCLLSPQNSWTARCTLSTKKPSTLDFCLCLRQMLTDFQNSFIDGPISKFAIMSLLNIPPHLNCAATLPCEISVLKNCRAQWLSASNCGARLNHSKCSQKSSVCMRHGSGQHCPVANPGGWGGHAPRWRSGNWSFSFKVS